MRKKFFKTRFVAMGLATAMVLSMVNVPAVANWQPPMANVLAAETYETGAETPVKVKFYAQNQSGGWEWMDTGEQLALKYNEEITLTFNPNAETFASAGDNFKFGFQVQDTSLNEEDASSEIAFSVSDITYNTASEQNKEIVLEKYDYTADLTAKKEDWGFSGTDTYVNLEGDAELLKSITSISVTFKLTKCQAKATTGEETVIKEWNFDEGATGWDVSGWENTSSGTISIGEATDKLELVVDYTGKEAVTWSQSGVKCWGDIDLQGVSKTTFDLYYEPSKLTTGTFGVKEAIQYQDGENYPAAAEADVALDFENAVEATEIGDGWKKVPVTITFDEITQETCCNVVILLIGKETNYKGSIYIDNLKMIKSAPAEDTSIDSTIEATGGSKALTTADGKLKSYNADGTEVATNLEQSVNMVDKEATAAAKAVYVYLKAVGESDSVIYGHQNDTHHKAGAASLSDSDTKDVTGSYAGVIGIDTLSLTGNEYSASRYNAELGKDEVTKLPETPAGNVQAAAKLTNYNIGQGAIITLSAHMPNFSNVSENASWQEGDPSYAKYDFTGYTPNVCTGDVMNKILPGGAYNAVYNAYLDMIADYASQVDGAILFRPFHENTGSWFWWGAAFCDAETYKNVYRYTVEYLRDEKGIHNLIWVYGPGSEASSVEEYSERYPGNDYVDMVGFDMYNSDPGEDNSSWYNNFKKELKIVNDFATANGKLIAVTETGVATSAADKGHNQTALHITGNGQKDWYNEMLKAIYESDASYYLLWANFGKKDGFYSPYVDSVNENGTLHGHEMLDNFIDFYNDARSVFAVNQKDVLNTIIAGGSNIDAAPVSTEVSGYITSPIAGSRILEPVQLTAKISGATNDTTVAFKLNGVTEKTLGASSDNNKTYSVLLDEETLGELGEKVGSIELVVNGKTLQTVRAIFNIPEAEADPYLIDDFENYYGVDSMLTKSWATNKATGSTIKLSLIKDADKINKGEYGLKFVYNETKDGWAGATISKEVNWSECNALQFYTIPDGNKQKYVIQITAGGYEYEAYLNTYETYANSTEPMLVTIPFTEFVDRDGDAVGGLADNKASIQSFGLWVNAIADTPVFADGAETVTGTLYYDNITAVKTDATSAVFKKLGSSEEDAKKVEAVKKAIEAIGNVAYSNDSKAKIDEARKAYDALTEEQKALVSTDTLKLLTEAEAEYAELKKADDAKKAEEAKKNEEAKKAEDTKKADEVKKAIEAIGEVTYTDDCKAKIEAAKAAYDALTDDQKALVGDLLNVLTAAEKSYAEKDATAVKIENKKATTNTVTLKWKSTEGAAGYKVYAYNSSKKSWVKVADVKSTTAKVSKISGKKLKTAVTYKFKVVAYDADKKDIAGSTLELKTATAPGKVTVMTLKKKSSTKASIKWKKVSGASGYEIYMKTGSGQYKCVKTIKSGKTASYTKSGLKKGKKYTFKVRAYKTADGKKIYGAFSMTKSIRMK